MTEKMVDLGQGFWNIRGDFRVAGVLNVHTQMSLVRRASGKYVFLDSYTLKGDMRAQVMALTRDGRDVEAVLNLHPFHTVHCAQMAQDFPHAKLYGSARHHEKYPDLDWQSDYVESPEVATLMAPDLQFSLPRGIDYISDNSRVHAGSLLARHPASCTVHVDDTFNVIRLPGLLHRVLPIPEVTLHPTLKTALTDDPEAVDKFFGWLEEIAREWSNTAQLCAAHSAICHFAEGEFSKALRDAAIRARPGLEKAHAARRAG